MNKKLETIHKAIRLANLDGIKELNVSIDDLLRMLCEYELLVDRNKILSKEVAMLDAKLQLCKLEKPIRLGSYFDKEV